MTTLIIVSCKYANTCHVRVCVCVFFVNHRLSHPVPKLPRPFHKLRRKDELWRRRSTFGTPMYSVRGGVGRRRSLISLPSGRLASAELSLHEQCRYTCKAGPAPQFHGWHKTSAADAVIVKDLQHPFVSYSYWPCLATVEQN